MVPEGVDASLVIRHAEREDIPASTFGHDVNLTAEGTQSAELMGAALSQYRALTVVSSPVPRCVQTAKAMLRGAGTSAEVLTDRHLGDPGAFIVDAGTAGPLFLELPIPEIARRQLDSATAGYAPTQRELRSCWSWQQLLGESGRCRLRYARHHPSVLVASISARP